MREMRSQLGARSYEGVTPHFSCLEYETGEYTTRYISAEHITSEETRNGERAIGARYSSSVKGLQCSLFTFGGE